MENQQALIGHCDESTVWDAETDVLVVGLGAAGASTALEASARGAQVTVLDRLSGGGASALSGGVVYAGGGTPYQQQANDHDSVENMFRYLQAEIQGAVSDETLRKFCEDSRDNLAWLESFGIRFDATVYDDKGSYPPDGYFLYYSGNELSRPFSDLATPSRRGHRTVGDGLTGKDLFSALRSAIEQRGNIQVCAHAEVKRLLSDKQGRIVGVEYLQAPLDSSVRKVMDRLNRWANQLILLEPKLGKRIRAGVHKRRQQGNLKRIKAKQGVVLSSGGFIANADMVEQHAPVYRDVRPLGEDCIGGGIQLGQAAGAQVGHMEKVSAWRFFSPPACLVKGVVVTADGRRICNEDLYGATIADKLVEHSQGKGWLIVDKDLLNQAKAEARPGKMPWSQWLPIRLMMHTSSVKANTLADLAIRMGVEADAFEEVIATYNRGCRSGQDVYDKLAKYQREVGEGPFYALDISIDNPKVPCLSMTLGGLCVDEASGQVLDAKGQGIAGLYAAGRAAVGLCSKSYISGLSLADCVFSGRRAARSLTVGNTERSEQAEMAS